MIKPNSDYCVFGILRQKGLKEKPKFHIHSNYEIFMFHGGNCKYAIGNRIYDLHPGDVLIMDGSLLHRPFILDDERFYERSIVNFSNRWIDSVIKALKAEKLLIHFEENHYAIFRDNDESTLETMEGHIRSIERYIRHYDLENVEMKLKLEVVALLLNINDLQLTNATKVKSNLDGKYAYVQQIFQYIQNHFHEKFALEDVASELNISKSYLIHLFKDLTGETIMDYTMGYRLKQALNNMAAYPNWSIKEIGLRCGFENESHFSRYFKEHVGYSPSKYRKKLDNTDHTS